MPRPMPTSTELGMEPPAETKDGGAKLEQVADRPDDTAFRTAVDTHKITYAGNFEGHDDQDRAAGLKEAKKQAQGRIDYLRGASFTEESDEMQDALAQARALYEFETGV